MTSDDSNVLEKELYNPIIELWKNSGRIGAENNYGLNDPELSDKIQEKIKYFTDKYPDSVVSRHKAMIYTVLVPAIIKSYNDGVNETLKASKDEMNESRKKI